MADSYVVSDNFRVVVARMFSRDVVETQREIVRFKIGEGGFEGSPVVPKTPSIALTDLESEGEPLASGGTVEFVNSSFSVVGSGTTFLSDVTPGQWIKPGPEPHSNPYSAGDPSTEEDGWGQVLTVVDDTHITLSSVYVGATHLFAESRPCHISGQPFFTFRKTLVAGDVLWDASNGSQISILVDFAEANATQLGLSPRFFEVGVFDSDGVMVAYGTLDERLKVLAAQISLSPTINF